MTKIVFFTLSLRSGGAERVVSNLSNALSKDNEVFILVLDKAINYQLDSNISVVKLSPLGDVRSGIFKFLLIPYYSFYLYRFLKKEQVHKVYSFLLRPNFISLFLKMMCKSIDVVISERSNPLEQYSTTSLSDRLNRFMIKNLYPKANIVTVNSFGSSMILKEHYCLPNKVIVLRNPINESFFHSRKIINETKNPFVFVTVGRLDEGKNHISILKAMRILVDKGVVSCHLKIIGTGVLLQYLKNYVERNNLKSYVSFLGRSNDVSTVMKGCDSFVFSSKREGFPNVVQEALASSLPIISTDCPFGPRELLTGSDVLPDPDIKKFQILELGILVPIDDELELAKAMEFMIDNSMSFQNNNLDVLERYKIEQIVRDFKSL